MKNNELALKIIELVGDKENIENVIFCSTRLRFVVKDTSLIQRNKIEELNDVYGTAMAGGQFQIVIGSHVGDVYKEVKEIIGEKNQETSSKKNIGQAILDYISNAFIPMVPALVGSGMIKGFLALFTSLGWLAADSTVYSVFTAAGNAVFYFIPFMISYNTAKYLKVNVLVGMVIVGALMEPNFTALAAVEGGVSLFGLPLTIIDYSNLIIPALIMTPILKLLEDGLKKFVPKSIQLLIVPMACIVILVPLLIMLIGPVSQTISLGIQDFSTWLNENNPILLGILVGGTCGYLTMLGMHLALLPIILLNFTSFGYDPVLAFMSATCYAQIGVSLAILFKAKDPQLKSLAAASSATAIISGISEPILFGLCVRYKRSFAVIGIAGAIGGAIMGIFNCAAHGFVNAGILGLPGYYSDTFVYYIIAILTTVICAFAGMILFGFTKEKVEVVKGAKNILTPIKGEVIQLSDLNDDVFASEMVGKGVAIQPREGKVFAPDDAEIVSFLPSNHAIGLKTNEGVELLIHVGINTVQLEGKYFYPKVKQGDIVKQGDLLLEFDIEKIKDAGYEVVTPVIITNVENYNDIFALNKKAVKQGDELIGTI